jgi:hypothetical protein
MEQKTDEKTDGTFTGALQTRRSTGSTNTAEQYSASKEQYSQRLVGALTVFYTAHDPRKVVYIAFTQHTIYTHTLCIVYSHTMHRSLILPR